MVKISTEGSVGDGRIQVPIRRRHDAHTKAIYYADSGALADHVVFNRESRAQPAILSLEPFRLTSIFQRDSRNTCDAGQELQVSIIELDGGITRVQIDRADDLFEEN